MIDSQTYLERLSAVGEARWSRAGVEALPWWSEASAVDEIASPARHFEARTHDERALDSSHAALDLDELIRRFELASGHHLADPASRRRSPTAIRGRIELTVLAVNRYGLRSSTVARVDRDDRTTICRRLRAGPGLERWHAAFRKRLDRLGRALSNLPRNAAMPTEAP